MTSCEHSWRKLAMVHSRYECGRCHAVGKPRSEDTMGVIAIPCAHPGCTLLAVNFASRQKPLCEAHKEMSLRHAQARASKKPTEAQVQEARLAMLRMKGMLK